MPDPWSLILFGPLVTTCYPPVKNVRLRHSYWTTKGMTSSDIPSPIVKFTTPENKVFYDSQRYKQLDAENDEIRLLEVLPGNSTDPVRCNLIEPPDSGGRHYECISYRAGDAKNVLLISVDGRQFNTFATLGAALRSLRLPEQSRCSGRTRYASTRMTLQSEAARYRR